MKYIFLIFIIFISLNAEESDNCYSVEIKRFCLDKNETLSKEYPQSCKIVKHNGTRRISCGCYDTNSKAQERMFELIGDYYGSRIIKISKFEFKEAKPLNNFKSKFISRDVEIEEKVSTEEDDDVDEFELNTDDYLDEYGYQ